MTTGKKTGGTFTDSCNILTPSFSVDYPPDIPVNPAKGSYSARWKGKDISEDFAVTEDSRSQLTFNGANGKNYNIKVSATVLQLTLNAKTNLFESKVVPCASITVAGQKLNSSCQTTLRVTGPLATINVTPMASASYYVYDVSADSPVEVTAGQPIP
jgi:hypothetical protein